MERWELGRVIVGGVGRDVGRESSFLGRGFSKWGFEGGRVWGIKRRLMWLDGKEWDGRMAWERIRKGKIM